MAGCARVVATASSAARASGGSRIRAGERLGEALKASWVVADQPALGGGPFGDRLEWQPLQAFGVPSFADSRGAACERVVVPRVDHHVVVVGMWQAAHRAPAVPAV